MLHEAVAIFQHEAERRGLTLREEIGSLPPVVGDRARLVQVFGNLVSNAIKYTPEGEVLIRRGRRTERSRSPSTTPASG